MVECDDRSLVDKERNTSPEAILQEIKYLHQVVSQVEIITSNIEQNIYDLGKNYPIITEPNTNICIF